MTAAMPYASVFPQARYCQLEIPNNSSPPTLPNSPSPRLAGLFPAVLRTTLPALGSFPTWDQGRNPGQQLPAMHH